MSTEVTNGGGKVASFSKFLDRYKQQMALALPKHMHADRMARLAVTAFAKDSKLQQCSEASIIASVMTASTLGLEIGVNGQGYIIPYKGTATFVPGWKGLVDLVSRSGRATVWTGAVFEGDDFDYALGDAPFVRHHPGDEDDPEKLTHVYAVGRANGSPVSVIEVWSMKKVWKHRDKYNKVGDSHYSFKHPEMYARKVPLLQVLKYLPCSIEVQRAIDVSHLAEQGRPVVIDGDFIASVDGNDDSHTTGSNTGSASRTVALKERLRKAEPPAPATFAQVADAITKAERAKDPEALEAAGALIHAVVDDTQRAELEEMFRAAKIGL